MADNTTEKEVKVTKAQHYAMVLEALSTSDITEAVRDELTEFINHEVEILSRKKSSKKSSKTTEEQNAVMGEIEAFLTAQGSEVTATDIVVGLDNQYSTSKVSAMLKKLVTDGKAVRLTDGKKVYFKAAGANA